MIHRSHQLAVFGLTLIGAAIAHAEGVYARPSVVSDLGSSSKANQLTVSEQTIGVGWQIIAPTSVGTLRTPIKQCQTIASATPSNTCARLVRDPNPTSQLQQRFNTRPSQQTVNLFPIDPLPASVRFLNITSP
ncbi:hypothetical protein ACKFKG_00790 [Phormidesmis sp. 146-35]